nr:DUF3552 domain-containing protein [Nitrospirota bacterium]
METILTSVAIYVIIGAVGALVGFGVSEALRRTLLASRHRQAEEQSRQIVQGAAREAENLVKEAKLEAKDRLFQAKAELEKEQKEVRADLAAQEKRLLQREENIEKKAGAVDKREAESQKREQTLIRREEAIADKEAACEKAVKEHRQALERVAGMTVDEAKRQLLSEIESEARLDAAGVAKRIIDEAKENAEREAREIIARSVQRVTRDYVSEATISVVQIPNDSMKGRIIGREGRNIRAIEAATGIDLIIDETPEAVIISGFDPMRREIAKISLERLMQDGRIHPTRIEEIVEKTKTDVEKMMIEEAE